VNIIYDISIMFHRIMHDVKEGYGFALYAIGNNNYVPVFLIFHSTCTISNIISWLFLQIILRHYASLRLVECFLIFVGLIVLP
jgi:putative flippase GtrA